MATKIAPGSRLCSHRDRLQSAVSRRSRSVLMEPGDKSHVFIMIASPAPGREERGVPGVAENTDRSQIERGRGFLLFCFLVCEIRIHRSIYSVRTLIIVTRQVRQII